MILDALKENDVKAIFFVTGSYIDRGGPGKRMLDEGTRWEAIQSTIRLRTLDMKNWKTSSRAGGKILKNSMRVQVHEAPDGRIQ